MGLRELNKRFFIWLIPVVCVISCTQHSTKFPNVTFHNITARYNAYYLAKEKLKEIEATIKDNHKDDFNQVLDVIYDIDTTKVGSYEKDLEYCREKCDVISRKHKNSKWVDDAYILVGKTKLYEGKFIVAAQFFKYVNTKSIDPNAKHAALIQLMRTFMEGDEEFNVIAASDYLEKEKLNHENLRDLSLLRTQVHLESEEYKEALEDLEIAIPHIKIRDEKSRAYFIAGQLRQLLGDNDGAYKHYKSVLRKNPPYEFEFYSKLNMAQVSDAKRGADVKKIQKYFDKLLKDEKNEEYTDRIYYEKGLYELKLKDTIKAIDFLNKSIRKNKGDQLQKAYSYLELGKVYYNKKKFETSKLYYDSTVAALPKDFRDYEEISERSEVLNSFVKEYSTVRTQDSLRRISKLSKIEQDKAVEEEIRRRKNRWDRLQQKMKEEGEKAVEAKVSGFRNPKSKWVFYNPNLLNKAKIEFDTKWGQIANEDNWRRSDKDSDDQSGNNSTDTTTNNPNQTTNVKEEKKPEFSIDTNQFYQALLTDDEDFKKSHRKSEESLYKLGKIYDLNLKEYENAIRTFETLIKEYPKSDHVPESMYFLYLLCKNSSSCSSDKYKELILTDHRSSIYAELILDTNFMSKNEESIEFARREYERAFELFRNGQYFATRKAIDRITSNYPHNDIPDKLAYVRAYTLGKTHGLVEFKNALEDFVKEYSRSDLIERAKKDLALCDKMLNQNTNDIIPDSVQVVYLDDDFKEEHYYAIRFNRGDLNFEDFLGQLISFNKQHYPNRRLSASKTDLKDGSYLVRVTEFINQDTAKVYLKKIENEESFLNAYKNFDYNSFIISKRNFNLLKNSSDIKGYLDFYRRKYRLD